MGILKLGIEGKVGRAGLEAVSAALVVQSKTGDRSSWAVMQSFRWGFLALEVVVAALSVRVPAL
jgi:hypothetical protein